MIAKVGLGLIGLSAISVGGVALNSPWLLGMDDTMPEWHSLSEDNGYATSYNNENHFGKKYGKYLVGVTNQGKADGEKHKSWWEWAYRRLSKVEGRSGKFGAVEKGYADDGDRKKEKALNQICKSAYKIEDSNGNFDEQDSTGTKFKKSEVWKYCSIGGTQPQTIKEFNAKNNENQETYNSDNAIAKENSEQEKLLSIKSTDNDWIWDIKDKEFRNTTIEGNGYFKKEKDKNNNERKTLKEICKWAYGQKPVSDDGDTKLEKTDVTKYCSLEGK